MYFDLCSCPFCDSEDVSLTDQVGIAWVSCNSCDAEGPLSDTAEKAAMLWNTRGKQNDLEC